jgi:hypothetical protein
MSDGKGSKKRENRKHVPYVVRVHEGEKGGKDESPPIGEKKKEGGISSFGKPFLPRRGGARYKYQNKNLGGEKKKMKKTNMAAIGIIAVFACLLLCTPALANNNFTDLNVTEIKLNCGGYLFGNESNEICAKIENNGSVDAGPFNVSFVIDGFSEEVRINGLAAGENTTVCVNDATSRNAGDAVTITVTADCNGEVTESDETNNESTMTTTVVNNGYKGKRYTGGEDITTWKTFELHGNLVYSVGDSYYLSSYSHPDWATELIKHWLHTIRTRRAGLLVIHTGCWHTT